MSLEALAAKGEAKLTRKQQQMVNSWNSARNRMIDHYRAFGAGPTRTANYTSGIQQANYPGSNPTKWRENWLAKMRE